MQYINRSSRKLGTDHRSSCRDSRLPKSEFLHCRVRNAASTKCRSLGMSQFAARFPSPSRRRYCGKVRQCKNGNLLGLLDDNCGGNWMRKDGGEWKAGVFVGVVTLWRSTGDEINWSTRDNLRWPVALTRLSICAH